MTGVVLLPDSRGAEIAAKLRRLADLIESGEIGALHAVVVVQTGTDLSVTRYGKARPSERLGILAYASGWLYEHRYDDV